MEHKKTQTCWKINQIKYLNLHQSIGLQKNDALKRYNTNSQIKFKTSILKSSSCQYSDAFILVKGTITVPENSSRSCSRK